ncbi:MAG: cyclic nucleotide-binding domain-containing protein [Candidatus Acidiferrales bacterium]
MHSKPAAEPPKEYGITLTCGEPVSPEELLSLPMFKGISPGLLQRNRGAVVRRRFKKGDIICREGEYGSTAFYILEGRAEVFLANPVAHVKTEGGASGFLSKLKSRLTRRSEHARDEESSRRWIPIDAPVNLDYDNPVAQLVPADLFGEMTCLSFYPRSATVRAATNLVVLEMLRNILELLRRNPTFRKQQEQAYRQRALDNHLRSVPLFTGLSDKFIGYLRDRVELELYEPGQVICKQGEPSDSLYVIRIGFVKVSQSLPGGELVLSYLQRGSCFGEIGLLGGVLRTATCTALDHVEVVRIRADQFLEMTQEYPEVRKKLEGLAQDRVEQNRAALSALGSVPLDDFLARGLMEAQSLLILDLHKCTRCDACVNACAESHNGVTRLIREGLRFDKYLVATSCRQCNDPYCMVGCPVGSIRRRNSLEIIIEDWCIGCGLCAKNCPYGNINMHPFGDEHPAPEASGKKAQVQMKATTCDLCADHSEPNCVYACPHDAAHRVDPKQFFLNYQK